MARFAYGALVQLGRKSPLSALPHGLRALIAVASLALLCLSLVAGAAHDHDPLPADLDDCPACVLSGAPAGPPPDGAIVAGPRWIEYRNSTGEPPSTAGTFSFAAPLACGPPV